MYFSTCNAITGIAQRMVDNNLKPDWLTGPKALGLMTGIVKFEYILLIQSGIKYIKCYTMICFMLKIRWSGLF